MKKQSKYIRDEYGDRELTISERRKRLNRKSKFKWKLVNSKGKIVSRHLTKRNAEIEQMNSGKAKVYVRKY